MLRKAIKEYEEYSLCDSGKKKLEKASKGIKLMEDKANKVEIVKCLTCGK